MERRSDEALTPTTLLTTAMSSDELLRAAVEMEGGEGEGEEAREVVDVGGGREGRGEGRGGRGSARAGLRFLCAFKYSAICRAYSWEEAAHK